MANWMAAIANGGSLYRPRVVSALVDEQGRVLKAFPPEVLHKANVTAEGLAPLREAMISVVERGTARQAQVPGVRVAGKTGTAQVGSKTKPRQIAWFGGYLPADKPELAFAVMVEGDTDQDLHGGSDAGTIAGNFFRAYYGVQPAGKTATNP
jgi:penicillin-binding protein 2